MTEFDKYQIIPGLIKGTVHIKENSQYHNIEADEVFVYGGVRARLFGTVKCKITIMENAKVFIHGSLKGDIISEGGRIYVFEDRI